MLPTRAALLLVLAVPFALALAGTAGARERVGTPLPEGAFHTPGGRYVDYTTPGAAALLEQVARELDVPLAGRRVVSRVVIVDRLDAKTYMTAVPPDTVLVGRAALEQMSGTRIVRADPGSVERALAKVLADPRQADIFKGLFAHEIGHLAQGHGRSLPVGTAAARAATAERAVLQQRLGDGRFAGALDDAVTRFAKERAETRAAALASQNAQAVFAADRARVTAALARGESFSDATRFLAARASDSGVARHERVMNLTRWVEGDPARFRGALSEPASFKLQRYMPPVTLATDASGGVRRTGARAVAAAVTPEVPLPFLHADEYLADQHAVTLRYRQTGSIPRSLAVIDGLGPNATWVQSDHPMRQTRLLNAVAHIQQNPRLFAEGLKQPVSVSAYADLPPVVLSRTSGGIQVAGAEAVRARVAAPDLMILDRYRQAQDGYRGWVARHESRPLLGRLVPRTSDALVAEGVAGRGPASGLLRAGVSGAIVGTAMVAGVDVASQLASGSLDLGRTLAHVTAPAEVRALAGGLAGGLSAGTVASLALAGLNAHWAGRLITGAAGVVGAMAGADLARGQRVDLARALVGGLATGLVMAALGPGLVPGVVALGAGIAADALYAWWKQGQSAPSGTLALLDVRMAE